MTATSATKPRVPKPDPEPQPLNREQSVLGLLQAAAFPLAFVDQADAAAVVFYAPAIAKGTAEVAANDPRFARVLDSVLRVGPYGALLTPVSALLMQLFANHNLLLKGGMFGTKTKDQLIAEVIPDAITEEFEELKDVYQNPRAQGTEYGNNAADVKASHIFP